MPSRFLQRKWFYLTCMNPAFGLGISIEHAAPVTDIENALELMLQEIKNETNEGTIMIQREDMLELTRRMTPARSHIDRIAGAYYDAEGYIDGTFNTHFLKLSTAEKTKNLELAKAVLQAETNKQLKDYRIPETARKPGSIWQLLDGIKESGLQNDAFLDLLYEMIGERVAPGKESYCFLFHGMYDVPVKGTDKEWQEGSEEVYNYLLCAVGQLEGEYEPGLPEAGFLYPAFRQRSTACNYINLYETAAYQNLWNLLWK